MTYRNTLSLIGLLTLFSGCAGSPEIQDDHLNDRVKACAAGFSEQAQAGLHATLNKAAVSGDLSGDVKQETRGIIFSEFSNSADKVKVYEDYISCIEKNWN